MPKAEKLTPRLLLVQLLGTAVLSACGGGGDSSDAIVVSTGARSGNASAGSNINASNYQSLGGHGARTVLAMSQGASTSSAAGGTSTPSSLPTLVAAQAASFVQGKAVALAANPRTAAVETETATCPYGGSIVATGNDADNSKTLSAGDTVSVTLNNCKVNASIPAINGSMSLKVNAVELDSHKEPIALDASGSFTRLSAGGNSLTGNYRLWTRESADRLALRMSFSDMSLTSPGAAVLLNTDLYAEVLSTGATTYTYSGTAGIGGQTYEVSQNGSFSLTGSLPVSGALRLKDAAGNAVELKAKAGALLDIQFYPAGANSPASTLANQSWTAFQSAN
jgi:ribosomal 50S subunit-recycling heat shock protein